MDDTVVIVNTRNSAVNSRKSPEGTKQGNPASIRLASGLCISPSGVLCWHPRQGIFAYETPAERDLGELQ